MNRIVALTVTAGLVAVICDACGGRTAGPANAPRIPAPMTAGAAARAFLSGYVDADGRVVRHDQGGDSVSEGQGYAMLLDIAIDDRAQFAAVWQWSLSHLGQPDGLLAYHWADGRVVDQNSASDADLDIARALILAGAKWSAPTWTLTGKRYAAAILDHETASAGGRLWLVAGPWARTGSMYIDPSYADTATFTLLAAATGDPRWGQIAASSQIALTEDTDDGSRLPSDWAVVDSGGQVDASPPAGGGRVVYGYDAFRTLVRQDDEPGARSATAAKLLPLAQRTAASWTAGDTFLPDGSVATSGANPLMLVGAAGAAEAAGQAALAGRYLDESARAEAASQSYYLDAWVALGRVLLTTSLLSPPSPASTGGAS